MSSAHDDLPLPVPSAAAGIMGQRRSHTAERAWQEELARVRALTPMQRMAEALELGDDDFGQRPTSARPRSR